MKFKTIGARSKRSQMTEDLIPVIRDLARQGKTNQQIREDLDLEVLDKALTRAILGLTWSEIPNPVLRTERTQACAICGAEFVRTRNQIYCSRICRRKRDINQIKVVRAATTASARRYDCLVCGKPCDKPYIKLCSDLCRRERLRKQDRERTRSKAKPRMCEICSTILPLPTNGHRYCSPECKRKGVYRNHIAAKRRREKKEFALRLQETINRIEDKIKE